MGKGPNNNRRKQNKQGRRTPRTDLQLRDCTFTLEALTLALGALIGVSDDGVENADIRRGRDVVLALKVF